MKRQSFILTQDDFWNRENFVVFFTLIVFAGMLSSRAMMSIGMIALFVGSLLNGDIQANSKKYTFFKPLPVFGLLANTFINPEHRLWFKSFFSKPQFWLITLIFFGSFATLFWSTDKSEWFFWAQMAVPFLVLPFAFGSIKRFSDRQFKTLLYSLIGFTLITTLLTLGNYALSFHEINEGILMGKPIPMIFDHISHIRFSLLNVTCVLCILWLLLFQPMKMQKGEQILLVATLVILVVALHVWAVRTGILCLYISAATMLAYFAIVRSGWKLALMLAGAGIVIGAVSISFFPSVKNKMLYSLHDVKLYLGGADAVNFSDNGRMVSIEAGVNIWKDNYVLGCGNGDLRASVRTYYQENMPQIPIDAHMLPHNQFVMILATQGVVGLLVFCLGFFAPFLLKGGWRHPLLVSFGVMAFLSFMMEATLITQLGTAFYLVILLVILNYAQREEGQDHEALSSHHNTQ